MDGNGSPVNQIATNKANRLHKETSPYLLQHAMNPVDWYAWGDEAIERAKAEDKPIFLSIGYSACHWCHVMEHESFENEEIAAILNEHFISIKVDREERPAVDEIYMTAVQMMTGSGGWPLSVFLTPELEPFYGGTYFPPESRYGKPGFKDLLEEISRVWVTQRAELTSSAGKLADVIANASERENDAKVEDLSLQLVADSAQTLIYMLDQRWGGLGDAPKFPQADLFKLLLREYVRTRNDKVLDAVTLTLDRMALGGMYDQLGGGFHRYAVDRTWLVPHFEKMLYDNAMLSDLYLEAYQVTGDELYRRVAVETMDYVVGEMKDEAGGFHSAEDADSEGEEGKYYVWSKGEIEKLLGKDDAQLFTEYYDVTSGGNFEGHNILNVPVKPPEFAKQQGIPESELLERLGEARKILLKARAERIRPGRDDKVLVSWNGLMISSLALGYQVLGEKRFLDAAVEAAEFILDNMMPDGSLMHTYSKGSANVDGYLDDYAALANAMVDIYETTLDYKWLETADVLVEQMIKLFGDDGAYYYTSVKHENLIARIKPMFDGAGPSANALAAEVLLRMARIYARDDYMKEAEDILKAASDRMVRRASGSGRMLTVLSDYAGVQREMVIVGNGNDEEKAAMLKEVHKAYVPNRAILFGQSGQKPWSPLQEGRGSIDGKTTLYFCENNSCRKPMTEISEIVKVLRFESNKQGEVQ
ncbi:hypothetical protein BVX97_06425 [bacterium E08(2017)]|nr:hypothetical protein BVX97_06425 [bacterium E08(2017)]